MKKRKIGVWQFTSDRYSGGRVYLYQYCFAAASLGHDVTLLTNRPPRWASDFPKVQGSGSLTICEGNGAALSFDILVTDAKGAEAQQALAYKQAHPDVPLFIVNFETSNWVAEFDPTYAKMDSTDPAIARAGDYFISISKEAKRHFASWLGFDISTRGFVVPPAINEFALQRTVTNLPALPRRYAVWVGHAYGYKGWDVATKAIWALRTPMDLVIFGEAGDEPPRSHLHTVITYAKRPETVKFQVMRDAHMCLAPSRFEGYGMVPGESLAVGTQCVVYDLPVLREAYGAPAGLHISEWNNPIQFNEIVSQIATKPKPKLDELFIQKGRCLADMMQRVATLPYH